MRISDGSSDVCSSDLVPRGANPVEILPLDRRVEIGAEPAHIIIEAAVPAEHGQQIAQPVWTAPQSHVPRPARLADRLEHAAQRPARPRHARMGVAIARAGHRRSEEHTSELQSLMRNSYAAFRLKKKTQSPKHHTL